MDPLMTTEELSDYLGVPIATIYGWRHGRRGPRGIKVGRYLRFRRSDVEAWLKEHTESRT